MHGWAKRVPLGGVDFAYGDAFPHDANMDLINGVDFAKGCYVGQEVVSRMKHRGALRKRILRVALAGPAPAPGAAIVDGELPVGVLGAAAGSQALALLRLDRVEAAAEAGRALTSDGARFGAAIKANFARDAGERRPYKRRPNHGGNHHARRPRGDRFGPRPACPARFRRRRRAGDRRRGAAYGDLTQAPLTEVQVNNYIDALTDMHARWATRRPTPPSPTPRRWPSSAPSRSNTASRISTITTWWRATSSSCSTASTPTARPMSAPRS